MTFALFIILILAGIFSGIDTVTQFLQNHLSTIMIITILLFLVVALMIEIFVHERKIFAFIHALIDSFCTVPPLPLIITDIAFLEEDGVPSLWELMEFTLGLTVCLFLYVVFIIAVLIVKAIVVYICYVITEAMDKKSVLIVEIAEGIVMFVIALLVPKLYIIGMQWSYAGEEIANVTEMYPSYIENVIEWMLTR